MAVFNSLTFDGQNSLDYGVYITGEAVYNAPERAIEMVSIPGRNGAIALDQGRFENIEVTYPAGTFGDDQPEFASKIRAFRNALASRFHYVKLTDSYHPDEYRLGLYKSGLTTTPVQRSKAGEFPIVFNCKPQRFLTSGETGIDGSAWSNLQTRTGSTVTINSTSGDVGIKSLAVNIEPIQSGSGTPSPTNVRPISGRNTVVVIVSPSLSVADGKAYSSELGRTVYKGTLDVASGLLEVTWGETSLGALSWGYTSNYFYATLSEKAAGNGNIRCDRYFTTSQTSVSSMENNSIKGNASNANIYIKDSAYTDAAAFKSARGAATIIYELAAHQTYQLSPEQVSLIVGTNNIWADCGDLTVQYGVSPIYNPTEFDSKPLIKAVGTGNVVVSDTAITITGTAGQTIYIDCESMEVYTLVSGVPQSAASLVSFSGNDFPKLRAGSNSVSFSTGIASVTITPRWWII